MRARIGLTYRGLARRGRLPVAVGFGLLITAVAGALLVAMSRPAPTAGSPTRPDTVATPA